MAKVIMVQGTMSNAGKSFVVAGLLRVLKQDGFKVAPFKSQNMALNSFVTKDGFEIGRAQVMQAEAAGIYPSVHMNPVLLKPTTDVGSQVIVHGRPIGNMAATEYFKYKKNLVPGIMNSYRILEKEYDIIVIEGAGSPAEINLKSEDIVNMGLAKLTNAPVILVGDINLGGIFAQLYGTVELLENEEKERIKGVVINKFRGDKKVLESGLSMLTEKIKKPVLGVIPMIDIELEDEDSLSEGLCKNNIFETIDIAVIKLPKISNFTDFNVLKAVDGVSIRFVSKATQLGKPDMIIIPGTKSTIADLIWLRNNGLEDEIKEQAKKRTPVFGICGGYQMLGKTLKDPHNVEGSGSVYGIGFIDMDTVFSTEKITRQVEGTVEKIEGYFDFLSGLKFFGYEIHMGESMGRGQAFSKIEDKEDGIYKDNVAGTYVHGIFDAPQMVKGLIDGLSKRKGIKSVYKNFNYAMYKEKQYDILAKSIRDNLDMEKIYNIIGVEK